MARNPLQTVFANPILNHQRAPRYRESVYSAIKEAVLAGQLTPGQSLVEEQLAALLQVSRTPVREALAILEHEQIIGARNGRGLYVRSISRVEFVEMFEANEVAEPYLARRAALLANEEQFDAMEKAIQRGRACIVAMEMAGFLRASRDFHRLVGMASGNMRLTNFVVNNEERTDIYLLHYGKVIDKANMEMSLQEHESIFAALVRRDPEAAARLVIYHAQSLRARFAELFTTQEEEIHDDEQG